MKVILYVLLFITTINLVFTAKIHPQHPHNDIDGILNDVMDQEYDVKVESRSYGGVMKEKAHSNGQLENRDDPSHVIEVIDGNKVVGSSVNLRRDVLSKLKGFRNNVNIQNNRWSKGTFEKALKELGIFTVKGLKVVKMKRSDIDEMKLSKDRTKMVRARKPRRKKTIAKKSNQSKQDDVKKYDSSSNQERQSDAVISKRTVGYDLCQEYVDQMYVLAHDSSQLAYQVESVRCEGSCYSSTYGLNFGTCTLATKTMVVYVIDNSGNFIPKTISPGCACECLHYNN